MVPRKRALFDDVFTAHFQDLPRVLHLVLRLIVAAFMGRKPYLFINNIPF